MFKPILIASALAILFAAGPAPAQDRPMTAPPGQGRSGPPPAPDDGARRDDGATDRTGSNAPARDDGDDLERARAAARAADPRLQGIERARAAARAADPGGGVDCMSARDARNAIGAKRAVSLAQALRTARGAWDGEVIDYKLCTYDGALAYDLTLLNDDGRVARVRIEAASGKLMGVR